MKANKENIEKIRQEFREFLGNLSIEEITINKPLMHKITVFHKALLKLETT